RLEELRLDPPLVQPGLDARHDATRATAAGDRVDDEARGPGGWHAPDSAPAVRATSAYPFTCALMVWWPRAPSGAGRVTSVVWTSPLPSVARTLRTWVPAVEAQRH